MPPAEELIAMCLDVMTSVMCVRSSLSTLQAADDANLKVRIGSICAAVASVRVTGMHGFVSLNFNLNDL